MLNVTSMIGGGAGISAVGFPSISGERFRYRADLGITKDGSDLVSEWQDQSGNDDHLTDVNDKPPLWVDAQVNGHPVVRFDGAGYTSPTGQVLQVIDVPAGGNETHLFMVVNQVSWTLYDEILGWGYPGYNSNFVQRGSTPQLAGRGGLPNDFITPPSLGTFFLAYTHYDGTTASYIALNDGSPVSGSSTPPFGTGVYTQFTLGGARALNYNSNIELAEVVVYDGVKVIDDDLTALKDYFNTRYALY